MKKGDVVKIKHDDWYAYEVKTGKRIGTLPDINENVWKITEYNDDNNIRIETEVKRTDNEKVVIFFDTTINNIEKLYVMEELKNQELTGNYLATEDDKHTPDKSKAKKFTGKQIDELPFEYQNPFYIPQDP